MGGFSINRMILMLLNLSYIHTMNAKHHDEMLANTSNEKLENAYIALQAWKHVIYSDPYKTTSNWIGPFVCNYTGVYCAPFPNDTNIQVVAGIDLNHADIAGFLPSELGLLSDLSLLHLNTNRFCGIVPQTFSKLLLLFELDLSNNRFVGPFPCVVLLMPNLRFLDIRYNEFEGPLPLDLFTKNLDAVFLNNNRFSKVTLPDFGISSSASVIVLANNEFIGGLPKSIVSLAGSLEELVIINTGLSGCIPPEVGYLHNLKVFDVSFNKFVGHIPFSLAGLAHLEQLDLGHNMLGGIVPGGVCGLPSLKNFTFSYNFFREEEGICKKLATKGIYYDERRNCLPDKPFQRDIKDCNAHFDHPVKCQLWI